MQAISHALLTVSLDWGSIGLASLCRTNKKTPNCQRQLSVFTSNIELASLQANAAGLVHLFVGRLEEWTKTTRNPQTRSPLSPSAKQMVQGHKGFNTSTTPMKPRMCLVNPRIPTIVKSRALPRANLAFLRDKELVTKHARSRGRVKLVSFESHQV